jgi:hypothetical protein
MICGRLLAIGYRWSPWYFKNYRDGLQENWRESWVHGPLEACCWFFEKLINEVVDRLY